MSTGLECRFLEIEGKGHFYILQDWDCPVGAFDWREYAAAYGPFTTEDKAYAHLSANHANPGGSSNDGKITMPKEGDEPMYGLITKAMSRSKTHAYGPLGKYLILF